MAIEGIDLTFGCGADVVIAIVSFSIVFLNMEDIRPTAKWANRMLRPLTSIYRRLEKHQGNLSTIASSKLRERSGECGSDFTRPQKVARAEDGGAYSDGDGEDPAWVPGKPVNRRLRHKYSTREEGTRGRRRNRVAIRSPEMQKTLLPGAIEIATPLITGKIMRETAERYSAQRQSFGTPGHRDSVNGAGEKRKGTRTNKTSFPAYQGSWKEVVDMSGDTEFISIAHLLDRVFLKFLNNTRVQAPPWEQTRGSRSLLSMAVRRLPEFIDDEQKAQDDLEDDDDVDMCDTYFYELEEHYAPSGHGWQPLREAVRAQGIYLVSEMIQRQWVTKLAACRLVEECMRNCELDAFEMLLSRCLSTVDLYEYPTAFDPPKSPVHCDDPVQILGAYYSRSCGRRSFVFDEMAKLLLCRVVPPEWMVTRPWKKCIDGAITSFSASDESSIAAKRLIEAVTLAATNTYSATNTTLVYKRRSGLSNPVRLKETRASATSALGTSEDQAPCPIPIQDALSNLTLSLMAALCGIYIARSYNPAAEEQAVCGRMRESVKSLAFAVQREVEVTPPSMGSDIPVFHFLRRAYVLLGQCLLQCGEDVSETIRWSDSVSRQNVEAFFLSLSSRQDVIKELATLVRHVFRCYEHVHKAEQTRTSPEIRHKILQLARLTEERGLSTLLGKVAAETAMDLAETTVDPDDHVWAVEVQEQVVSLQREHGTRHETGHGRADNSSGLYRWEESIGEWVASTPVWKAKAVEVTLRNAGAIRRPPSTIADSMSSDSPPQSPYGDSASSATSSAPSVSMKRSRSDSASTSSKRRCSTPVGTDSDGGGSSDRVDTPASGQTCELVSAAPVAHRRTRRGALREPTQTGDMPGKERGRPVANFEVVITNPRAYTGLGSLDEREPAAPLGRTTRSGTSRNPTATKPKHARRRAAAAARRASGRPTVIPCSQDDESDDELSFL